MKEAEKKESSSSEDAGSHDLQQGLIFIYSQQ